MFWKLKIIKAHEFRKIGLQKYIIEKILKVFKLLVLDIHVTPSRTVVIYSGWVYWSRIQAFLICSLIFVWNISYELYYFFLFRGRYRQLSTVPSFKEAFFLNTRQMICKCKLSLTDAIFNRILQLKQSILKTLIFLNFYWLSS